MITNFILAPIIAHMATAVILLFFWQKIKAQKVISIIGNSIAFLLCIRLFIYTQKYGFLTLQAGNWKAPFGISFVSDSLSSVMVLLTAIVALAV